MTSNQISYAGVLETTRHNQKMEELEDKNLALKQQQIDVDRVYKEQMANITKEYNDIYLEMQNSQGKRKLELQAMLNNIEEQKMFADSRYKQDMAIIESNRVDIQANQQKAQEMYWNRLVDLGYSEQDIKRMQAMLEDKRIEYQKTQWLESNHLQEIALSQELRRNNQQYTINWLQSDTDLRRTEYQFQELELRRQQLELERDKLNYQKTATAIQAAQHSVDRIWNPIKFFKSLGGNR